MTKAEIFNLALGACLLKRQIANTETDTSNECRILNTHWSAAFGPTLGDLDLDGTSSSKELQLIEEDPNERWLYAYTYPQDCALIRRIESQQVTDNRSTRIPLRVGMHDGEKVIFTNQEDAWIEYLSKDIAINHLSDQACLAVAYKLASLSAPLLVGKGAKTLVEQIDKKYIIAKADAQKHDRIENWNFIDEDIDSEFVEARTT